jgi:hypothetical protein
MPTSFLPITKSEYLVSVSGIDQYWETFSGIKDSSVVTEYNDGLANRSFQRPGRRKLEEMTLGKGFDPELDAELISYWKQYRTGRNRRTEQTIAIVPVEYTPDPEPIGKTIIIYGVKPISFEGFEVDRNSADVSKLMLKFIADDYEFR